jgi:mono/diheme cytochrome c family protein
MKAFFRSRIGLPFLRRLLPAAVASWAAFASPTPPAGAADAPAPVSYFKQVRPILQARCQGCHQPAKDEGGYVMTDVARMRSVGDSGSAGIVPGKPDESHLVAQIEPDADGVAEMPKDGKPLTAAEIELVRRWIAEGAQDDAPASAGQQVDAAHPPQYSRQPVVTSLDFSPDGSLLAVTGFHEVLVFDVGRPAAAAGPRLKMRLVGLAERVERVRFSPDGTKLAVTGGNPARLGEVQIWNVADGSLLRSVPVTFDTVYGGCWSPDGKRIAFGCTDNTLRAIDVETGEQVLHQGAHEDWVLDTVFSPKGDHVISVGRDMTVKLTELATQRFVDNVTSITPGALRGGLAAVDRHPTLEHVVVAGADGTPRAYRIHRHTKRVIGDDANLIFPLHTVTGRVFSLRFSPDGRRVAAAGGLDGRGELVVASYDLAEDVPRKILDIMAKVPGETREKGSQRSKADWQAIDDYRDASTKVLCRVETPAAAYATAFHPRTGDVAVAGGDGVVRFFDAATGTPRGSFAVATIDHASAGKASLPLPWPTEPTIEPEPAAGGPVASLVVEPPSISIDGPFSTAQLVVIGTFADGRTADLTRSVRFEPAAEGADPRSLVAIGPGGLVRPLADGSTTLRIVHGEGANAVAATVPVRVAGTGATPDVDFIRDVNPVLAKMGCNQGTCHGAAKGKNGFKLSLRGYDPIFDLRSLTDDHGSRRVNLASPDDSLMLLKASATAPHTGGLLAKPEDPNYQLVRRWIEQGAKLDLATPRVRSIRVHPPAAVVDAAGRRQQFRVVADYADGTSRDVTRQAFLESGNTEVATADPTGLVTAVRRGEAPILVRYEGAYAAVTLTVMGDRTGFEWSQPESWGTIDDLVADKWRSMKILPAPLCSDADFLRRVTLDLTGLPPTAADVRRFLSDPRDPRNKRADVVGRLIGSEAFVEHWTNKWADLLQVNPKFLGPEGAKGLRDWIRRQVADNVPHDRFVREILTASGSNREHPAAAYFKTLRDPLLMMENTTHLFLGVRFNCNKCHDHPFERWTQDQYYETAAFFAQVRLEKDPESHKRTIGGSAVEAARPLWEIVADADKGEVKHERTGKDVPPRFPFECRHEQPENATRRQRLAAWITSPDNAYFARSQVNRLWGYLFGTGIIDPIDDIRAGNPPTNPALLEHLTRSFIDGGFDTRKVLAEICTSRTYGLAIDADRWNEDDRINYSHALPRRLPAETIFDALHAVIGSPSRFPGLPVGTRAAQLTDVSSTFGKGFLATFGRPARESACECERAGGVALGPVMALASGPAVGDVLADPQSELAKLVASEPDDAKLVDEVFLRVLNRPSRPEEAAAARNLVGQIVADHVALTAELAAVESTWAAKRSALEAERQQRVDTLRRSLAEAIAAHEPVRQKREQERAERIAEAIAAVERYHGDPNGILSGFEAAAKKEPRWQVLRPTKVDSSLGAKTEVLADGSVLARGDNQGDEYMEVRAPIDLKTVTAIRLEVIPDPRLPGGGSGRAPDGSFVLTEIGFSITPAARPNDTRYVTLESAAADFVQDGMHPSKAVNGDDSSPTEGWAVSPRQREPHWAVFQASDAADFEEPMVAVFRIVQRFKGGRHAMGRFRLSCTDAAGPVPLGVPPRAVELAAIPREKRTAAEAAELDAIITALDPRRAKLSADLAAAARPLPPEPTLVAAAADLADAERPLADDPAVVRLRNDHAESTRQLANSRLTAFQDLAWALINSPAFFFNH